MPASLGVYIHYPWCRRRCDYCDFAIAVAPIDEIPQAGYRDAVLAELAIRADELAEVGDRSDRRLVSIYLGGGTPSIWSPSMLREVIAAVADRFAADLADLEVTLEANPIDCQPETLERWRDAGINRLSIGVQSTDGRALAVLGRDHAMGDGIAAVTAASGRFPSLSADVILGTPTGGPPRALEAIDALADRSLGHISVYELTIEERAPLGRAVARGELEPLDGDRLADLYLEARERLIARGYEHYEISSFARPGHRSRHNSLYWTGGQYLGLGSSASSFVSDGDGGALRWSNHRSVGRYLAAPPDRRVAERRQLGAADHARDRVWLGMRTVAGFEAAWLERFEGGPEIARWLLEGGLAEQDEGVIRPTLRGFLLADRVAERVLSYP